MEMGFSGVPSALWVEAVSVRRTPEKFSKRQVESGRKRHWILTDL